MDVSKLIALSLVVLGCCNIHISKGETCYVRNETSGKISHSLNAYYQTRSENCWIIRIPQNAYLRLYLLEFNAGGLSCNDVNLSVEVSASTRLGLCQQGVNRTIVASNQDAKITFSAYNTQYSRYSRSISVSFGLSFVIESMVCLQPGSFRCSNVSCIPRSKVCDGIEDCENGTDERGCDEYGSGFNYHQLRNRIIKGISWLKIQQDANFGWTDNTPRAIIALYLAKGANFNGTDLRDELAAKQLEFELALGLLRNSTDVISPNGLSLYINALLAICRDPHHFHGYDLIQLVTSQRNNSQFVHPVVYLAICNANGTLPRDVRSRLLEIFKKKQDIPYLVDTKAMAVMAASCIKDRQTLTSQNFLNITIMDKTFDDAYNYTIRQLQDLQISDGSFGNVYSTALISQALLSAKKEYRSELVIQAAVKYLVKELNKTSQDFLTTYWSLPVLLNRSLADLSKVNCFNNPRREKEVDEVSDLKEKLGPKMRVQFSLYIGDENDITHTIYLRVAQNSTAYEIMQLAESVDKKYKFEAERRYGKLHIYKIGNYTNDPENGKFWSFYYKSKVPGANLLLKTIDDFIPTDGDHIIMWFRTAAI